MNIIIKKDGLRLTRRFELDADFEVNLRHLKACTNPTGHAVLAKFLAVQPADLVEIASNPDEFYAKDYPLPWHLKILLSRVLSKASMPKATYTGLVRTVRGFTFYRLFSSDPAVAMPPPKFEPSEPPRRVSFQDLPDEGKRGIADLALALAPSVINGWRTTPPEDVTIINNLGSPLHVSKDKYRFTLEQKVELSTEYDRFLLQIHRAGSGKQAEILIANDNFAKAFQDVADLWHSPGFSNFLLVAPPGSGKEVLVEALCAGLGMTYEALVFGAQESDVLEAKLFGARDKDGLIPKYATSGDKARDRGEPSALLFFDEVDKCDCTARSVLLRLLESKDFLDVREGKVKKLRSNIKFGLAGSMPWEKMKELHPHDFWTRIQHRIVMQHPLHQTRMDGKTNCKGLQSYFTMFWRIACDQAMADAT